MFANNEIKVYKKQLKLRILGAMLSDPEQLMEYVARNPVSGKYCCVMCNNFSHMSKSNVRNHVESIHFPDTFSYSCSLCTSIFKTRQELYRHRSQNHRNVMAKYQNS